MRTRTRAAVAALALSGLTASVSAAMVYDWSWTRAEGAFYSDLGGRINWAESTYDPVGQILSWRSNFGSVPGEPGLLTDGFTVALNAGFLPLGNPGEMAHLYVDASHGDVRLNAFGYNGNDDVTSHRDGSAASGVQEPDRIASSLLDGSWVLDAFRTVEGDGTATMGFTIDVSAINAHVPVYPGKGPWTGMAFGPEIGIWFHPLAGSHTAYVDGYLTPKSGFDHQGFFDIVGASQPVPEASTLALVSFGLIGGWFARRRRSG